MARYLLIALVLALGLSGCLRTHFDRCDDEPPHPDCAHIDGAIRDDASMDASNDGQHDAGT
jgi:hypothetical protein